MNNKNLFLVLPYLTCIASILSHYIFVGRYETSENASDYNYYYLSMAIVCLIGAIASLKIENTRKKIMLLICNLIIVFAFVHQFWARM